MGQRIFKSKVLLNIITLRKNEDTEEGFKVINEKFEMVKGKDLQASISKANPMEVVYAKPEKFVFGVLYVLANGERAWIYKWED